MWISERRLIPLYRRRWLVTYMVRYVMWTERVNAAIVLRRQYLCLTRRTRLRMTTLRLRLPIND